MAIYRTLDRATLERLYVAEGLSLKEVAARLGPPATKRIVQRALQLHGIPLRLARPPAVKQELMTREFLERLYIEESRPIDEITEIVGFSRATVLARLRRLGIERRERSTRRVGDRQPLTRELLHELRVVQRLPAAEIGRRLGYTEGKVRSALASHGMVYGQHRGTTLDRLGPSELWWLHHHQQLSVREIATRLRTHAERVAARLHESGVGVRQTRRRAMPPPRPDHLPEPDVTLIDAAAVLDPRHHGTGARRDIPAWPWPPDPALLRYLYVTLDLGLVEIANRLRVRHDLSRSAIRAAGIPLRHEQTTHAANRRWKFDPEELRRLSVVEDRTAAEIAAYLGVSEAVTQRALHRYHLPTAGRGGEEKRVRYDDLLKKRTLQALDSWRRSAHPAHTASSGIAANAPRRPATHHVRRRAVDRTLGALCPGGRRGGRSSAAIKPGHWAAGVASRSGQLVFGGAVLPRTIRWVGIVTAVSVGTPSSSFRSMSAVRAPCSRTG